ncbi:MAG: 4Fe-4S ferredoxin [Candidatus Proteinoplasmatales archaeon SG8-5]|nr:MAG: 4Fe-4S ferredoxin [Candidatus Proteinoplasmatales archaeon SG8-5]
MIEIIKDWCKGCEICVIRCPVDALEISAELNKRGVYPPKLKEENECNFCRLCELLCPDFAITVIPEEEGEPKETKSRLIIGGIVNEV